MYICMYIIDIYVYIYIQKVMLKIKKMTLFSHEENKSHLHKTNCCIRQEKFGDDNDINQRKVRDHCHYTGKYRSAFW